MKKLQKITKQKKLKNLLLIFVMLQSKFILQIVKLSNFQVKTKKLLKLQLLRNIKLMSFYPKLGKMILKH